MLSFKGYVHRFLAQTVQVAHFMHDIIMPVLKTSAAGAVSACNADGVCGFRWNTGTYDTNTGAGQQMNALGAMMSLLIDYQTVAVPLTNTTGGTSVGNAAAGGDPNVLEPLTPLEIKDKVGAGILTAVVLGIGVSTFFWISTGLNEHS
jgi:mannan endo-1,6-alpha-mannosidase